MSTSNDLIPSELLQTWERRGPTISARDVTAFERRMKLRLSDSYREFLVKVNGGRPGIERCVFNDGIVNSMLSLNDPDESRNLEQRANASWGRPPHEDLLLIGHDDGGGPLYLCIRGDHDGEVWFLNTTNLRPPGSNPRVKWFERRDMWMLGKTFVEFLRSLRSYDSIQRG